MVALGCFPCVRIFAGMKHWTAWVHLHRKYSIYHHELNHAQPAGAGGICVEQSSVSYTVIHFVSTGANFGTCTVVNVFLKSVFQEYRTRPWHRVTPLGGATPFHSCMIVRLPILVSNKDRTGVKAPSVSYYVLYRGSNPFTHCAPSAG